MSRKRPRQDLVELNVLHCPKCLYWARSPAYFHEHYLTHKDGHKVFKCSGCDEPFKLVAEVNDHIRTMKHKDKRHFDAKPMTVQPVPVDGYIEFRRLALVPEGSEDGWNPSVSQRPSGPIQAPEETVAGIAFAKLKSFPVYSDEPCSYLDLFASSEPATKKVRLSNPEEEKCLEEMNQLAAAIHEGYQAQKEDRQENAKALRDRIGSLRNRAEVMKGKVYAADRQYKELQAKKEELGRKLKEAAERKVRAELAAKTHQCEVAELSLQMAQSDRSETIRESIEEARQAFRGSQAKVERMDGKMRALQAEEQGMDGMLDDAKKFLDGLSQELNTIKAELNGGGLSSASRLGQLKANNQKRIDEYFERGGELVKMVYQTALDGIEHKENEWLDAIENPSVEDDQEPNP